ncbi:MmgE/PrpD family protein [Cupriavidus basilensis]|uniref:MmgE/PrpD family protein n=1 Tax=Cupriavidus basilensis TaxID=68895 RepID=UPI0007508544|nr:MmgE/PrpD family protein [Cupriavidus basilensis]
MTATDSPALSPTQAEQLAAFALNLRYENIPGDVLDLAREHLLDVIGIALASNTFEFAPATLEAARTLGSGTDATAIGSGRKLPAASAALVNGVLAHGLDFDDTHIGAIYHASAQAMATALACGEANRASGRDALVAFVVALEIGCRLAAVGAGRFHDRAFHPTALCGTFASAAAAGRLHGMTQQQLVWALGLCGSLASGILESGKSWLKRLHPGWAAHSGIAAAALGRAGFQGPATVLEGHRGFYAAHIEAVPEEGNAPARALGSEWQARGIALKPYPCCHFIHAFVDAALELRGQFALDDIERIDCPLTPMLHKMVAEPRERCIRPPTPYAALFSVQYAVAVALVKGRVDLATFHDEPIDDPAVLAVAAKTFCVPDTKSDFPKHFPGEVVATLRSGRVFRCRMATSLGTPDNPMSRDALLAKFVLNASRAIPREQAESIARAVFAIDDAPSLAPLMALCTMR